MARHRASHRTRRARGQTGLPGAVPRDHPPRDPGGARAPGGAPGEPGEFPARPARPRLSGGLQPVAGAVVEDSLQPLRRTGAESGASPDRGSGDRDRSVRGAGVLEHTRGRSRSPALFRPSVQLSRGEDRAVHVHHGVHRFRRPGDPQAARLARARGPVGHHPEAPPRAARSVHHRDAAAGGFEPSRIQREPDHARRATAVRRGWRRRPHHLHANRFGQPRGGSGSGAAGLRGGHVRSRRGSRDTAAAPHAHAQRAGGARSGATDLAGPNPRLAARHALARSAPRLRAHLAARGREPDEARGHGRRDRRPRLWRGQRVPGDRLHGRRPGPSRGLRGSRCPSDRLRRRSGACRR